MGLQYGIKEVLNVNLLDLKTKEPLVYIDYATATSNEQAADRLFLTGGWGNARQMAFDHTRTSTLKLTVPMVDVNLLAILTGEDPETGVGEIFKREIIKVVDNSGSPDITLSKTPVGAVTVYKLEGSRDKGDVVTIGTVSGMTVPITTGAVAGDEVIAFYQYVAPTTSKKVSIKTTKFPRAVEIYGEGLARNQEDGQDYPVHVHVFSARPQANFTFTMEGTNATNLELTFDLFSVDNQAGEGEYIEYIFETE